MHQSTSHPSSPSPPSSPTPAREHHSLGRKMKKPFLYVKDHLAPKHHDDTETTPPRAGSGRGLLKRLSLSTSHIRSPSDTSTSPPPSPTPPSHRRHRTTSLHSLIHHISFHPRSSSHTMAETPKSQDLTESPPETLAHRSSVESERPGSLGELSSVKSSLAEEVTPIAPTAAQVAPSPEVSAAHEDKGPASGAIPIAPAAEVFATPVAPMDEEFAVPIAPAVEEFATLVVLEVEESVPAPAVEEPAPAPAVEEPAPAPAVEEPAPAPAVEEPVPAPAVEEAVPAPAVEEAVSAPAVEEPLPAPAVEKVVPAPAVEEPVPAPAVEEPVSAPAAEEVASSPEEAPSRQDDGQVSAPVEFGESATREDILAPPAVTKPEIPEPFLIEDVESPVTESEPPTARLPPQVEPSLSASQVGAAEDISLSLQTPVGSSEALPVLVVEEKHEELAPFVPIKPVVAPPSVSDSSESEAPAIYLPQLVLPAMFLPIPNTDPLTTLLMKYIPNSEQRPRRDVTGEWAQTDFHTLVMTNSWRALARMARDRLVQSDPEDIDAVLNLWSLRLSALARLRLFNQTAAETTNLFTALHGVSDPAARAHLFAHVLPFELEVLHARVKYWAGDALGYVDALGALLGACRTRARRARSDGDRQMWMERGARVGLIAASQFVEMKDYIAATRLLEPLLAQPAATPDLRSAIARVYLQAGQLDVAAAHFAAVAAEPDASALTKEMNAVLLATARGEWDGVSAALRRIVESDPENFTAVNNLSVALLSQGKLKEATEVLEAAFQASPSTLAMAEPFLFNLSTLYELRSGVAVDKKRDLLVQVAQWSGDGLRTTCLKMPSN